MLQEILDNKYVSTVITLALALYAALLGPNLPTFVKDLFNNTIFRIFILFLVVVRGNKDPKMAIMIAVAFVLTLDFIYANTAKETFTAIEHMQNSKAEQREPEEYDENYQTEYFADYEESSDSETENFTASTCTRNCAKVPKVVTAVKAPVIIPKRAGLN